MRTSYLTYADYCRKRFGGTVQKIAVDGDFACPNRDGTLGLGGCTFCAGEAFAPSYCRTAGSITEQIDEGITATPTPRWRCCAPATRKPSPTPVWKAL